MPDRPSTNVTRKRTRRFALAGVAGAAVAAAIAAGGTLPAAHAATVYNPLAPALGFNSFVEDETLLASTESEGGVATGGNLVVAGSYNVNIHDASTFTAPGDSVPSALVVGGRVDFGQVPGSWVVQVHDYAKVGDLTGVDVRNTDMNNASVNTRVVADGAAYESVPRVELNRQQPLSSVGPASPIDFGAAFEEFRSNAEALYGCDATEVEMRDDQGAFIPKGGVQPGRQVRISLAIGTAGAPVTNVLNVTGEDLNNMSDLVFLNPPDADSPLVVNVDTSGTGGEMDWTVKTQAGIGGSQAPYIIWNFRDATRLSLVGGDTVEGSILAPDADYADTSPANVEGQIIARNAHLGEVGENGGEIHHFPFAAEVACSDDVGPDDTTEAPATDDATEAPTTEDTPANGDSTTCPDGGNGDGGGDDESAEDGDGGGNGVSASASAGNGSGSGSGSGDGNSGNDRDGSGDGPNGSEYECGQLAATGGDAQAFMFAAAALAAVGAVVLIAAGSRRANE
jgi:choice-of-anchor A domain-containing protein